MVALLILFQPDNRAINPHLAGGYFCVIWQVVGFLLFTPLKWG